MVTIDKQPTIVAIKNTVNPTIKITVVLKIERPYEIPISYQASITDRDDKNIAFLSGWSVMDRTKFTLYSESSGPANLFTVSLYFQLTRNAIDYIETLRGKNSNGDLDLILKMLIGSIDSKISSPPVFAEIKDLKAMETPNYLFRYNSSNNNAPPMTADRIKLISTNDQYQILDLIYNELKWNISISSSDWAQKFCPILGIGKYISMDLYVSEIEKPQNLMEKNLTFMIETIDKMEKYLQQGEWSDVIEKSRPLAELLRNIIKNNDLSSMFKSAGYNDQTIDNLRRLFIEFFDFSSKFVHRIEKNGSGLMEKNKVEKEDAYFIYAASIGIVNLISKKVKAYNNIKR